MNFKKVARDRMGRTLDEGDIFLFPDGDDTAIGVVCKIIRHGRDSFPDLQIVKVTSDWLGKKVISENATIIPEIYRLSRRVNVSHARDDSPKWIYVRQVHDEIIASQKKD